jgi:hypothetical protein
MKKLSKYKLNQISENIDYFFNNAKTKEIQDGKSWYLIANNICQDMAQKYDTTTLIAAQVIAALSPRNKWRRNIEDAYVIFDAVINNIKPENIKVCTFHTNKFKAYDIAKNNIKITDKSLKTYSFCNNIANLDPTKVTIDIWALRACFNKSILISSASIGRIAYTQIENIFLNKGIKLGLTGFELQAILWLTCQRMYKY